VVVRVLRTDQIISSALTNAQCEFEEGDIDKRPGTGMIRHIDISFYGDLLKSGKSYIVWGTIQLTAHDSYTEHPKVNTIFQINNWSRMLMSRSQTRYQRSGLSLTLLMILLLLLVLLRSNYDITSS
jgi:hypothetical protein